MSSPRATNHMGDDGEPHGCDIGYSIGYDVGASRKNPGGTISVAAPNNLPVVFRLFQFLCFAFSSIKSALIVQVYPAEETQLRQHAKPDSWPSDLNQLLAIWATIVSQIAAAVTPPTMGDARLGDAPSVAPNTPALLLAQSTQYTRLNAQYIRRNTPGAPSETSPLDDAGEYPFYLDETSAQPRIERHMWTRCVSCFR